MQVLYIVLPFSGLPFTQTCLRNSLRIQGRKKCSISNNDGKERKLFDLNHDCSKFGSICEQKRNEAKNITAEYYKNAKKEKSKKHKPKGAQAKCKLCHGISSDDPRPNGVDRYIDYLNERTIPNKPSHGFYGKLSTVTIRDPTCRELKKALDNMCTNELQLKGNWGSNDISMGLLCGMGTTWDPKIEKCVQVPDEYITIDGLGQPFARSVYPTIRPRGYRSIFDEPNDKYVYLEKDQLLLNSRSFHRKQKCTPTYPGGTCTSERCRFPLTSKQGQQQAKIYVKLFRMIYEYQGDDQTKQVLKLKIRTLIDNHGHTSNGIHRDGLFLPWHRWYILEMETILMEGQSVFRMGIECSERFYGIPYFDWHNLKNNQSPKEFINNANDELGHHFHESLGQNTVPDPGCVREGALAGFKLTNNQCLSRNWLDINAESNPENELHPYFRLPTQYNEFRWWLEHQGGFHDSVHTSIGGVMSTITKASNDPIFFTHHGNVDKIWGDWQKQSCGHKNYFDGVIDRNSLMSSTTATPADMLHLDALIYTPQDGTKQQISVNYVDFDTSSAWGDGSTLSIKL